jgi:hypothetical protein
MSARAVERVHPSAPGHATPRWYLPLANLASLLGVPANESETLRMILPADPPTPSAPLHQASKDLWCYGPDQGHNTKDLFCVIMAGTY